MNIEQALNELLGLEQSMRENHWGNDRDFVAIDMSRQALELMQHIKDRPCLACEFKVNGDCTKWTCVFDAWLHAYVYGKEQNDNTTTN